MALKITVQREGYCSLVFALFFCCVYSPYCLQGLTEYALHDYVDSRANISVLRLMMDFNSESCLLSQADMTMEKVAFHDGVQLYSLLVDMKASMDPSQRRFSMRKAVKNVRNAFLGGWRELSKCHEEYKEHTADSLT